MELCEPAWEQSGFTQVSEEPVSSATDTSCGGFPMETKTLGLINMTARQMAYS
jgi:hypothetical protein